jgi:hypothetical protein
MPDRVRRASGKSDGERPADIVSIAKVQRMKAGATEENALDYRWGSTIGQLRLEGSISEEQLTIAQRYARIVSANARLYGVPSPNPRSAALLMAGQGLSCEPDMDPGEVERIKGQFRDCRRALLDCGAALLVGSRVNRAVYGIIVENWPRNGIGADDIQNLRCGLNALGRLLRQSHR